MATMGMRGAESSIVLYCSPGACSLAVHMVLEELRVPYRLQLVSIEDGQTMSPEFLKINPKGRVPVVDIDGVLLTEAPAILVHLAATYPAAALLPTDAIDRFRCLEWLNWLSSTLHSAGYGPLWRPSRFIDDPACFDAVSARGRDTIADAHRHVEAAMVGHTWAVGGAYSCVDPYLSVFYLWGMMSGFPMRSFPAWSAVMTKVLARPAVARALEMEGIRLPG